MTDSAAPLVFGFDVRDSGEIIALNWDDVRSQPIIQAGRRRWIHLNRRSAKAQEWIEQEPTLDRYVSHTLFREDTRPRALRHNEGWIINLRGVNFNPGDQDDVMISLRTWLTPELLITTRSLKIRAVEDLANKYLSGDAPETHSAAFSYIAERLTQRLEPVIEELDDLVNSLDERLMSGDTQVLKSELSDARRKAIAFRRYMSPQREALSELAADTSGFFLDEEKRNLREALDGLIRVSEDLEAVRDRAQVVQEQITELRAEEMNQRLFILSIVSAIFLPLGFITGLFGVNVGGMPGVNSSLAFLALCGFLIFLTGGLFWLFRKLGWMR
jgi:zinc transporter